MRFTISAPCFNSCSAQVYIVTSPATHEHFLQLINTPQSPLWGFPSANLLQYPEHTGAPAPVNELQFALEEVPCLTGSFVAVARYAQKAIFTAF